MSNANQASSAPQSARFMRIAGAVILICVALYYLFLTIDGAGLADQTATATVLSLEYSEGGKTYVTQIVNNRPYVLEQVKPDSYIVKLDLDGREAAGLVSKELFEELLPGEKVDATYQRRRITGALQVISVAKLSTSSRPVNLAFTFVEGWR